MAGINWINWLTSSGEIFPCCCLQPGLSTIQSYFSRGQPSIRFHFCSHVFLTTRLFPLLISSTLKHIFSTMSPNEEYSHVGTDPVLFGSPWEKACRLISGRGIEPWKGERVISHVLPRRVGVSTRRHTRLTRSAWWNKLETKVALPA